MARTAVRSSGRRPGRAEHLASVLAELPLSALRAVDHCFAGDPVSEIKSPLLAGSRRAPALGAGEVERDRPGLRSRHPPVVLALSTGPIWLVVDVLHSHVLGSGLLLQGAPDLRALVEPDRAEPDGSGEGSSAEEPVGNQDDSGQKERAEFDIDLALFRLGVAQGADTLRQGAGRDRELRNQSSHLRGKGWPRRVPLRSPPREAPISLTPFPLTRRTPGEGGQKLRVLVP
jgi:hypothetical protein